MDIKKILSSTKGLTLIELLASLTILGIVIIGIMNFFTQAYSYTNSNQKKTAAINVARNATMYMEKQNFIVMKKRFDDHPTDKISLLICNDNYTIFWESDHSDTTGCHPITINNIPYTVTTTSNMEENYKSFLIPLETKVEWKISNKTYSTQLEGVLKSEDIR